MRPLTSALSCLPVAVVCAACATPAPAPVTPGSCPSASTPQPLILENAPSARDVGEPGWVLSGGAHDLYAVRRDGTSGWVLEPVRDTFGRYATWMRVADADEYRGKRVRITAPVKTKGATRRVDVWARVQAKDSPGDGRGLGGDWQQLASDSDWATRTLVLDVPAEGAFLEYGVGVAGPGTVSIGKATVEVVGTDVPLTGTPHPHKAAPAAAAPATTMRTWALWGDEAGASYAVGVDTAIKHGGKSSGFLRSIVEHPKGFGSLGQSISPDAYAGKRVRMTGYLRSEAVVGRAAMWMRVDGPGAKWLAYDNMDERPIKGTTEWTRYEIVLDVAKDAVDVAFGAVLRGSGRVWLDDVTFEVVKPTVATTDKHSKAAENLDFEQ